MLATVAASPFVASATFAATDVQFGPTFFCRFTTMLPIVALAVPVLVTVITPFTVRKLSLVAPRVTVTVQSMGLSSVRGPAGPVLSRLHSVLFVLQSPALQLVRVMLAWPAGGVVGGFATALVMPMAITERAET